MKSNGPWPTVSQVMGQDSIVGREHISWVMSNPPPPKKRRKNRLINYSIKIPSGDWPVDYSSFNIVMS